MILYFENILNIFKDCQEFFIMKLNLSSFQYCFSYIFVYIVALSPHVTGRIGTPASVSEHDSTPASSRATTVYTDVSITK